MKLIIKMLVFCFLGSNILGAQEIFDAIKANDSAKVKALIQKDASQLHLKDATGNTPLHQAAISGAVPIAEYLLSNGADINATNTQLNTPLHEALRSQKNETALFFINNKCNLDWKNVSGYTPVHFAGRYNCLPALDLLIAQGADLEIQNNGRKQTPLTFLSMMTNNVEAARKLVEAGANLNAKDRDNFTPLAQAIHREAIELINYFLDKHADIDTAGGLGKTMLSMAAGIGMPRLFKYIMEIGGEPLFIKDGDRSNYMRSALRGGSIEIVKILQSKNIPINLEANLSGWTPLHYAASGNKMEMIEFLVKQGADINQRTNAGKSVYNIADENGHKELLPLVLKLGGSKEPQKFPILTGPYYGQQPPGKELKRFAPGIIAVNHSSVSVSPDGKEIYWADGQNIRMAKLKDGKWTQPEYAPFSGTGTINFYDDVPFVTPDNKRLFFTSLRPLGANGGNKENIWYVEREGEGWGEPKPVSPEVNALTLHWQVSVSSAGTLYFQGNSSTDGRGIYYSRLVNGEYSKPLKMEDEISKDNATCPFISPDESYILFTKDILGNGVPVPYISYKSRTGKWIQPINLEKYIPQGNNCMIVTPDRKYLFVQGGPWIDASFIEELRSKE